MESKNKSLILTIAIITILTIGIVLVIVFNGNAQKSIEDPIGLEGQEYTHINEDMSMTNTSTKLSEPKKIGDIEIKDIKLETVNAVTTITATVLNNGTKADGDYMVKLRFLDDGGKQIIEIGAYINATEPGSTSLLSATTTLNFVNAYDFEVIK